MSFRFVILFHKVAAAYVNLTGRKDHFDLMIECAQDDGLATWTLPENPFDKLAADCGPTKLAIPTIRIENHRTEYLTYEGPVSNDRGHVTRVAQGQAKWIRDDERIEVELTSNDRVISVWIEKESSIWTCF